MLAASSPAPNTPPSTNQPTPTPGHWHGVSEAMLAAKKSVQQGQLKQAEQLLMELLEFAPVEIKAWKLLAQTQRQLGHIEAGIASARRALQLQNNPLSQEPLASITLVKLLRDQHEYDEATQMLDLLLDVQPDDVDLLALKQQWQAE